MARPFATWVPDDAGDPLIDALLGRSPLATACHDRSLRVVYVNAAMAAVGRAPAAAYRGRPLAETAPALGAALMPFLQHVLDTGTALSDLAIADGDRHWSASCHPLHAVDGSVAGVCSILYADTDRFDAERRLRESEERHRALVERSPDGIALVHGDRIAYVNPAAVDMLGARHASELAHRSVRDFAVPDAPVPSAAPIWGRLADGHGRPHDVRIVRLDGSEAVLSVRSVAVDTDGAPVIQTIFRDVTRRRAEERTRDQASTAHEVERTLLQAILQALPVGVVVIDRHGKLILANEASERIWGVPFGPWPLPLEPWSDQPGPTTDDTITSGPLRMIQALSGELRESEVAPAVVCGDGVVRNLRGSVRLITSADGRTRGALATFWDETALFRTQDALRRAQEVLEARVAERAARIAEASEQLRKEMTERAAAERELHLAARLAAIGTLAGGVAHEINNPLASIVATAELARAMNADGARDEVDAALARIVDEAHRGGDIVKGLLRLGHTADGERWPVDVNDLVRTVIESPQVQQVLGGCRLRTRLVRRPLRVVIDPTELEHLLLNLVQNAVQAGATEVTLRTALRGQWARLVVGDDGRGIEPADRQRIFDPFFTTRGDHGGTGLGLSIVHGIVTRCDGRITVASRVGRGSRFTVDLPVEARRRRRTCEAGRERAT